MRNTCNPVHYYSGDTFEAEKFGYQLAEMIQRVAKKTKKREVLILCIGSDRSTGDSLGPLTGYLLKQGFLAENPIPAVVGTLELPVHAVNLEQVLELIERDFPQYMIVVVDASVGSKESVGYVTLTESGLKPGYGVNKNLRQVGDISITGIVSWGSRLEPMLLQNIRLGMVMNLAGCISKGIFRAFDQLHDLKESTQDFLQVNY